MVGSVIHAIGALEFEDSLRIGVLPGGCWYILLTALSLESILISSWGAGWSWVYLPHGPLSDQDPTCLIPNISAINVKLLHGINIKLA